MPPAGGRTGRGSASRARLRAPHAGGALRDELCDAGGRPLIGWGTGSSDGTFSPRGAAFGQRFPNPTPREFRRWVDAIGRHFGFRVFSLRLLRPRQLAPVVVVHTSRDRKAFTGDFFREIMELLNPGSNAGAGIFEGMYFEALDAQGPFLRTYTLRRGQTRSDLWSAVDHDPCGPWPMPPSVAEACARR
jgi:hypothetical protein